jgi:unsaturated rhamnogalacturonyl hydrolase
MRPLVGCIFVALIAPGVPSATDGCATASSSAPPAGELRTVVLSSGGSEDVAAAMIRVLEWQLERLDPPSDPGWIQSTFMIGAVAAYESTGDERYLDAALAWAERNKWRLASPTDHADAHGAAQVYLDLARITGDPAAAGPTAEVLDAVLATPGAGRERWSWCDALFMTPPALARLAAASGDAAYLDAMDDWWWDATELLYDSDEWLYHRDAQARSDVYEKGVRSAWENKLFWSRGNAWVLAGIARLLPYLPEDYSSRGEYTRLFRDMAATIAPQQGEDGLWGASLLDPRDSLPPESSASALFCYALAWGINEEILPRDAYLPIVLRAWEGLVSCVGDDGAFGWVQPPGRRPALSFETGTAPYGAGAFLLAGSEVFRLR